MRRIAAWVFCCLVQIAAAATAVYLSSHTREVLEMRENITPFPSGGNRAMTVEQYRVERQKLTATYGESKIEAGTRWEQELAKLFNRSGWTQEQLAKHEGYERRYVGYLLIFGEFLGFVGNGTAQFQKLTEYAFRTYWKMTSKGNNQARFREVLRLMEEPKPTPTKQTTLPVKENYSQELHKHTPKTQPPTIDLQAEPVKEEPEQEPKGLGEKIMKEFADGKFRSIEEIQAAVDEPMVKVKSVLDRMKQTGSFNSECSSKPVGKTYHYRIIHQTRKISADELRTKLGPIVNELDAEGRKGMDTMSPHTVRHLAHQLKKLLDEWTK